MDPLEAEGAGWRPIWRGTSSRPWERGSIRSHTSAISSSEDAGALPSLLLRTHRSSGQPWSIGAAKTAAAQARNPTLRCGGSCQGANHDSEERFDYLLMYVNNTVWSAHNWDFEIDQTPLAEVARSAGSSIGPSDRQQYGPMGTRKTVHTTTRSWSRKTWSTTDPLLWLPFVVERLHRSRAALCPYCTHKSPCRLPWLETLGKMALSHWSTAAAAAITNATSNIWVIRAPDDD